jgi:hypothetical protein
MVDREAGSGLKVCDRDRNFGPNFVAWCASEGMHIVCDGNSLCDVLATR